MIHPLHWAFLGTIVGLVSCARHAPDDIVASSDGEGAIARSPGHAAAGASASGRAANHVPPSDENLDDAVQQARELVAGLKAKEAASPTPAEASKPTVTVFLGAFSEADVARAVDGRVDPALTWRIAEWRFRQATLVALSHLQSEFGARLEALSPRLFVVERRAGALEVVARGAVDLGSVDCRNESGDSAADGERQPRLSLDLGNYEVAPKRTAVGVRFTCFRAFPAGEGSETRLLLFEQSESRLKQVFDTRVAHSNFDRPTGNETSRQASVTVERDQHEGHYDQTVHTAIKTIGVDPVAFPQTARDSGEKTEQRRYLWRSDRYVPAEAR